METSHLLDKKFILNENYTLKSDLNRILLSSIHNDYDYFHSFIHPVHAILLSKFKGDKTLKEYLKIIAADFSIPGEKVLSIVLPFIDNDKIFGLEYENQCQQVKQNQQLSLRLWKNLALRGDGLRGLERSGLVGTTC